MHLKNFLPGLAASDALNSPINRRGEPQCLRDCVKKSIEPFLVTGAEEGFRLALGAHNTMEKCMSSADCMETVQTFIEEITQMVFKDRLGDKNGHFANSPADGYTGSHCDANCLVKTVQTAAGQAGAVAMAVGQKHFYGNDALWNRWSPQRMLELDRAIRQLKGRNLAEKAHVDKADASNATGGHLEAGQGASVRKLDLAAFRYNGTAEIPLLHHPKISRAMARKILSYIPGYEIDPKDTSHDAELGEAQVPAKDYFLAADITGYDGFEQFDKESQDIMQVAYSTISQKSAHSGPEGFAHFLYHERLYPNTTSDHVQNFTAIAREPWSRVLNETDTPIRLSPPRREALEDGFQLGAWVWQHHAYAVANTSFPVPGMHHDEDAVNPEYFGYREGQNKKHGPRLVQWVTDTEAEPLKDVQGGYTHQPWTDPWFFEYRSNYSSFPTGQRAGMPYNSETVFFQGTDADAALAIRGYTFELRLYSKAFEKEDEDYFRAHAFDQTTGAVVDSGMLAAGDFYDDYKFYDDDWPYVTAVTGDGRAFHRRLSDGTTLANGKQSFDILDEGGKPIFDQAGEPVRLLFDTRTGLAETKYGRAYRPLDKFMGEL